MSAGQAIASQGRSSGQAGFTLIELLTALAVLAILSTLALPGFSTLMWDNRAANLSNELVTALNVARSEAIKRGESVTLCAMAGCATTDWSKGWQLLDDGHNKLREWQPNVPGMAVTAEVAQLVFDGMGRPAASLDILLETGHRTREISVSRSGLVRVSSDTSQGDSR
ncbi:MULTISPECIES: GspH/FimT family pseudopilin [unclassified Halomonas]|uniref:GspH/FimT family pseudopilin n=1 Tax=unclassified Halomonas TaxID=2609666 RepID=UPI00159A1994|nr:MULTISPECIES: GspH/FimT family pseudopilin [unclassified Halomonas]QJQ96985.1 prepilin-type N-terminal cleavage/methylation domain-containing protein [Halomonas sp. PA5]